MSARQIVLNIVKDANSPLGVKVSDVPYVGLLQLWVGLAVENYFSFAS